MPNTQNGTKRAVVFRDLDNNNRLVLVPEHAVLRIDAAPPRDGNPASAVRLIQGVPVVVKGTVADVGQEFGWEVEG